MDRVGEKTNVEFHGDQNELELKFLSVSGVNKYDKSCWRVSQIFRVSERATIRVADNVAIIVMMFD